MRLLFLAVLVSFGIRGYSQRMKPDSVWYEKRCYYYVGIQANLLLQQFISFNSNSSINNNPFLCSYTFNNSRTGMGMVIGTGLSINQSSSNDGVALLTTENTNVSMRIGFERKYMQRTKFIPFWGLEIAAGYVQNKTTSKLNQSFNNPASTNELKRYFFGPSLRGGLNYALSRHILIGTEFFLNAQIAFTQTDTDVSGFRTSSSSTTPFNIGFQAPTALFLIFRY